MWYTSPQTKHMLEKREYTIKSKVVKISDLRNSAHIFFEIFNKLSNKHDEDIKKKVISEYSREPAVKFTIQTNDNAEYSTDNLDLFNANGVLDTKVITRFTYVIGYYEKSADVTLSVADSRYISYRHTLTVQGSDTDWVSATFQKLQDCISTWESQESKIKKYRLPLSIITALMICWIFSSIVFYVITLFTHHLNNSVFYVVFAFSLGVSPTAIIYVESFLKNLWPDIEFIPMPEHKRVLTKKRARLGWFFSIVVVPFLITLIVDLLFRS